MDLIAATDLTLLSGPNQIQIVDFLVRETLNFDIEKE